MQNDKFAPPPIGFSSGPTQPGQPQQGYPAQYYGQPQVTPAMNYGGPPPAPPPPPYEPPTRVPPSGEGCFARGRRNRPQGNSLSSASLIFMSGGLNIAWSMGFRGPIIYTSGKHNYIAWFIGGIIGALISCFLTNKVAKKYIMLIASALVSIGGLVIACTKNNGDATVAGCYLDGIANGLVFAPFLALAGEVSVADMRGKIATNMEQIGYNTGFLLQIIYTSTWYYSSYNINKFTAENLKGAFSAIFGLIALLMGVLLTIESPVQLLANNDEQGAIDSLRRLQKPATLTDETYDQLAEHKRYLAHNKDLSVGQSISQALPTFVRLAYLRALNAMSLSSFVALTLAFSAYLHYGLNSAEGWYLLFAFFRFIGACIPAFGVDSLGRKKLLLFGLLLSCAMGFAIGVQYNYTHGFHGVTILIVAFAFFAGLAFTGTSAYLSEAYPLGVKQHFLAFTFIVEMLVYMIITLVDFNLYYGGSQFFYAIGSLYLVGFIVGCVSLPETRLMTLRGAQELFNRVKNTQLN
ncbi:hypothetical protein KR026_000570 [Drosophila bipectinata]|nr:hypothetical protein KR026_000570 [Drosophila bipectinata]